MSAEHLGEPLTGSFPIPGGTARLYERGATITGEVGEVVVSFKFPSIGVPQIAVGEAGNAAVFDADAITFEIGGWQMGTALAALRGVFSERLALLPTGRPPAPVPLVLGTPVVVDSVGAGVQARHGVGTSAALQERQLYDLAVRADDGQWRVIAPHALYYRSTWHDFGSDNLSATVAADRAFPAAVAELGRSASAHDS
jgi:hypothetical protein